MTREVAVVHEEGHEATIRVTDGYIYITWVCGDQRKFTPDGLAAALEIVTRTAAAQPDVWVTLTDGYGSPFAVQIRDGELYADRNPFASEAPYRVPWDSMKKAVAAAVKQSQVATEASDEVPGAAVGV